MSTSSSLRAWRFRGVGSLFLGKGSEESPREQAGARGHGQEEVGSDDQEQPVGQREVRPEVTLGEQEVPRAQSPVHTGGEIWGRRCMLTRSTRGIREGWASLGRKAPRDGPSATCLWDCVFPSTGGLRTMQEMEI